MDNVVFVQPHFDDVALSCGGTVATLAETSAPRIVTVFGGEPDGAGSAFARFQHERWNVQDDEVVTVRRSEDRAAALALGASVQTIWMNFLDAIYRQAAYSDDHALFGEVVADDLPVVERIAAELSGLGNTFVVPMGVGNHVDHQLVWRAGERLRADGKDVWMYVDMPYALDQAALDARVEQFGALRPCRFELPQEMFERRWSAIESYASQLPVLFRSLDNPRAHFEAFGRETFSQPSVELFWQSVESERRDQ